VQIGTAFLVCEGSGASKAYQAALLSQTARHTDLTDTFTGRLGRAVRNRLMDDFRDMSSSAMPFPVQHSLAQTIAVPASVQERTELMTMWAGQSAGLCRSTEATQVMAQLIAEAEAFFSMSSA
jgi:nitronate monooxygenase